MPDLIIKPTATSGNKLILKDQAGGAVLTTADSGATIANATLTTPTIASMANCTFPAGHVVQTVNNSYNTSNSATMTGQTLTKANVGGVNVFTASIPNVEANNWVFINMTFIAAYWRSHSETSGGWGIFREDTAIYGKSNTSNHYQVSGGTHVAVDNLTHISFMDKSPATGTNNYYLGIYASSSSSLAVRSHSNYMGFNMTLQEIKV